MGTHVREIEEFGLRLVELSSDSLVVRILPERGASIVSIIEKSTGTELLWRPRWGLRSPGQVDLPGSSEAVAMGHYPGGWSTLFPNAGAPSIEFGVEWQMHGEVWLAPHTWSADKNSVTCESFLVRSPFRFQKTISVVDSVIRIDETAVNLGADAVEVLWNQHPAFAAPLLDGTAVIRSNATTVFRDIADPRVADSPVKSTAWPQLLDSEGVERDLSAVLKRGSGQSRRAFLSGFPEFAHTSIINSRLGLAASIQWSSADFPYMWYWLEAGGRRGFPWFGAEYVLGLEPCTSYPSAGIGRVRELSGTQVSISPGASVDRSVELEVALL